jgi:hypothetical protein
VAETPPLHRVALQLDACDALQDPVADVHRVADQLERHGVLREPRHQVAIGAGSECEDQVLVSDVQRAGQRLRFEVSIHVIDAGDAPHDELAAAIPRRAEHLADRRNHVLRKHRGADHLGQHRVEGGVALLADQHHAVAARQLALQRLGECRAGEAAADDDDVPAMRHEGLLAQAHQ